MELTKTKYKQTEVGLIPEDWEVLELKETLADNPKYGIGAAATDFNLNLPTYLRITDIEENGTLRKKDLKSVNHRDSGNYFLKENDLVFARTGASVGKSYLYDSNDGLLVYAGFLIKVSTDDSILIPQFLKAFISTKTYWKWVTVMSMRSGQPGINSNELGNLNIPLPSLPEQKAIAQVLNDTDNLIQAIEQKLTKKTAIKQGAMQQLLTPKEDWAVKRIEEVVRISTGSKNTQDKISNGKYPFYVRSQTIEKINSYSYECEAVLTAGDGVGTGKIFHYVNHKFELHQRVYIMNEFSEELIGYYFFLFFSNNFFDRIMQMTAKSSVDSVRREMIADMQIPLPPIKEQIQIATILSDMDAEIAQLEQKLSKYKMLKQGLIQNLLTGKIRLV